MSKFSLLASQALLLFLTTGVRGDCPAKWKAFDGTCYLLEASPALDARVCPQYCQVAYPGASQVVIDNADEDTFVQLQAPSDIWIGTSLDPIAYSNWADQPASESSQGVAFRQSSGQWEADPATEAKSCGCELPEPPRVESLCPEGWLSGPGNAKCYQFPQGASSSAQCESTCSSTDGGRSVCVTNALENQFVAYLSRGSTWLAPAPSCETEYSDWIKNITAEADQQAVVSVWATLDWEASGTGWFPRDSAEQHFCACERIASTHAPSTMPTAEPTADPTALPTALPTADPTADPSADPSAAPTLDPTAAPSADPSADPSTDPTAAPTANPSALPSVDPTTTPTFVPTAAPSVGPTAGPTARPSASPTADPSAAPSFRPTLRPTTSPSVLPTVTPTTKPSANPTTAPSIAATAKPTVDPTAILTVAPSVTVTATPTTIPCPVGTNYKVLNNKCYQFFPGQTMTRDGCGFNCNNKLPCVWNAAEAYSLVTEVGPNMRIWVGLDYTGIKYYWGYATGCTSPYQPGFNNRPYEKRTSNTLVNNVFSASDPTFKNTCVCQLSPLN